MSTNRRTPGVYINEVDAFSNSIVGVPTSMPLFVGYTEKAKYQEKKLTNKPTQISSLKDYNTFFGGAPNTVFSLTKEENNNLPYDFSIDANNYKLEVSTGNYLLYNAVELFYLNGGGTCYIISIGDYNATISQDAIVNGLTIAEKVADATLLLVPDANLLDTIGQYCTVVDTMLLQCATLQNRFAIIDVYNGTQDLTTNVIEDFRNGIGEDNLSYGATYYPFLRTTLVSDEDIQYTQITPLEIINSVLESDVPTIADMQQKGLSTTQISQYLLSASPNYKTIIRAIAQKLNIQPPSGAMAGLYTMVDNERGVWSAPANISPIGVTNPTVAISDAQQGDLNVPVSGKAINAIRFFVGRGTLVWGARTLDGNNNDWRYIQMRRTIIYIETSIKNALNAYVFSPNVSNTWATVQATISSFLTGLWQQGGLLGSKASEAYTVQIGLGSTMTSDDILNGIMRVNVSICLVHPAEFIELSFTQMMQGA